MRSSRPAGNTHRPTDLRSHRSQARPGPRLLALASGIALVLLLAGPVAAAAALQEEPPPVERLQLDPAEATIRAGGHQPYIVVEIGDPDRPAGEVTGQTQVTVTRTSQPTGPAEPCERAVCSPTRAGRYVVTATLTRDGQAPLTGTARLTVLAGEPATLQLVPREAQVHADEQQRYRAVGSDEHGNRMDLTARVDFAISGGGSCATTGTEVACTATTPGIYRVTATLDEPALSAGASLTVIPRVTPPRIDTVEPASSSPNQEVLVTGSTGTCNRVGTLTMQGTVVRVPVSGEFTARFTVPSGTWVGTYQLRLRIECDELGLETQHGFEVTNRPPVPVDDPAAATLQDQPVTIDVLANDSDPDDPDGYETVVVVSRPDDGTADVQPDNRVRYTPHKGFTGEDRFAYAWCDIVDERGTRDCGRATVTVTVRPQPQRPQPVPVDDPGAATLQDQPVAVDVMANDRDPDADRLQVKRKPAPKGTADKQADGTVRYTPAPGFTGTDHFAYDYCGAVVNLAPPPACPSATVTVEVRPRVLPRLDPVGPVAPGGEAVVTGTTGSCGRAGKLSLRLRPPDVVRVPVRGSQDGTFEARLRVPPGTFRDSYRLELVVACGGQTLAAERQLEVVNRPPVAVDDQASTTMGTPVTVDVTANDTDPDGDDGYRTTLKAGDPPRGTALVLRDQTIRYTPDDGFTGVDRFGYRFCDVVDAAGGTDCGSATVTVVVGRRPPMAVDDTADTVRDQPVTVEVMANDRDPDDAALRVLPAAQPGAKAEQRPDGTVRYTPAPGFTGEDSFHYDYCGGPASAAAAQGACAAATVRVRVTDLPVIATVAPGSAPPGRPVAVGGSTGSCARAGTLALSGTALVATVTAGQDGNFTTSLTIPPGTFPGRYTLELAVDCKGQAQRAEAFLTVTNQPPVAADDAATTLRDHPVTVDVTANDHDPDDPDGHPTRLLLTSAPVHGTAQVGPDQAVRYTPAQGFVGTDRFRYALCDDVVDAAGHADCGTATVTVTVTGIPVIASVAPAATPPARPVIVVGNTGSCARAGRLDLEGTGLEAAVGAGQDGNFTTTVTVPAGTLPGAYTLRLAVDCAGRPERAEARLTVTNQAPVAADDRATTAPGVAVEIEVTANDHDPDDPDSYRTLLLVTSPPAHGTAEERSGQAIRYTPDQGFAGTDRFRYALCDDVVDAAGHADCGTATVTVVTSATACSPAAGDRPVLHVSPHKGRGGTMLHITATVDPSLSTCHLRLLLDGTPLGPEVSVGTGGTIAADRRVPGDVRPGPSPVRLATMRALTVAETSFEVVPVPSPLRWPLRLAVGAAALLAGGLGRAAVRKLRRYFDPRNDLRAEPHTRPVVAAVEPAQDNSRSYSVRLEAHRDPGAQTVQEVVP